MNIYCINDDIVNVDTLFKTNEKIHLTYSLDLNRLKHNSLTTNYSFPRPNAHTEPMY